MKKRFVPAIVLSTLLSGAVLAGGATVAPMPAEQNWSGYYVGAELGGGWTTERHYFVPDLITNIFSPTTGGSFTQDPHGVIGGVKLGRNMQFNRWLVGLETSLDGVNFSQTTMNPLAGLAAYPVTYATTVDWLYTLTPRFGVICHHFLFFGKLGVGVTQIQSNLNSAGAPATFFQRHDSIGVDAGAGVDYALRHWVMGVDYDYIDFGTTAFGGQTSNPTGYTEYSIHSVFNTVKASVSYLFNA